MSQTIMSYQELKHCNKDVVVISGSFKPNGSAAPTLVSGRGFTVAHNTNIYTVALNQQFAADHVLHFSVDVASNAPTPLLPVIDNGAAGVVMNQTNKTFTFFLHNLTTTATDGDMTTDGTVIMFTAIIQRSSIPAK